MLNVRLFLVFVAVVEIVAAVDLYPYDTPEDISLRSSSHALSVQPPFQFYENVYNSFYVNIDGSVSFGLKADFTKTTMNAATVIPAVCAFCADIHKKADTSITYRITNDSSLLTDIAQTAGQFEMFQPSFHPVSALVVTWENVGNINDKPLETNTFQAVLAHNAEKSLVMLMYKRMTWVIDTRDLSANDPSTVPIRTQAGFLADVSKKYYLLDGSRSEDLLNVTHNSNIGIPGKYLFRVDTDIMQPVRITTTPGQSTGTSIGMTAVVILCLLSFILCY